MRKKRKRGSEGEGEAARGKGRRSGMKVCGERKMEIRGKREGGVRVMKRIRRMEMETVENGNSRVEKEVEPRMTWKLNFSPV